MGWLAQQTGTIFIKRGSRSAAKMVHQEIVNCLMPDKHQAGKSVLLFPEGTTSNRQNVLRFRPRLLNTAIQTKTNIQPVTLYFPDQLNGINPIIPFIEEQTLSSNLWALLGEDHIDIEVHFLDAIESEGKTHREIAMKTEEVIREQLLSLINNQK